jgi:hypothetical protein
MSKTENFQILNLDEYKRKLKSILSHFKIDEVIQKLLSKLKIKDLESQMIENKGENGKWKCILNISYSGEELEAEGINDKKKKAKSKNIYNFRSCFRKYDILFIEFKKI